MSNPKPTKLIRSLPVTDRETARVVIIYDQCKNIVGAGCLLSNTHVMTCWHVVVSACPETGSTPVVGTKVSVRIIGYCPERHFEAEVEKAGNVEVPFEDIAILKFTEKLDLVNESIQFATPLRHEGKRFSTMGFPFDSDQGATTSGMLHCADAYGLVQLDSTSPLWAEGGFSGSPVWSQDLGAYIGIVCTARVDKKIAWCIPSRLLARFYPPLAVRFQIPSMDRPAINDWWEDDPNLDLFGTVGNNGQRSLSAKIRGNREEGFTVTLKYRCIGDDVPRGSWVTFVNYPDFEDEGEDAYLLFAKLNDKKEATVEFYPNYPFTVAAIGDAGDTALTVNLEKVPGKPKHFKTPKK